MASTNEDALKTNIETELAGADPSVALVVLTALALETARDIGREEALGPIGEFGIHPGDSAALLELRQIIDDEIGWSSEAAEREADYPARLRQIAAVEKAARADHDACIAHLHDEELAPTSLALREALKASGAVMVPTEPPVAVEREAEAGGVPAALMEELSPERLAVGRGR